jgi:hypothetical protein
MGPTDPVTLKPIFAGCISNPGALPVTITANGCDYLFGVSKPGTTGIVPITTGRLQAWSTAPPANSAWRVPRIRFGSTSRQLGQQDVVLRGGAVAADRQVGGPRLRHIHCGDRVGAGGELNPEGAGAAGVDRR